MNRRRYLLSVLNMDMFRAVLFNNLYHDIIPNTIADRKARNNGKARLLKIEGNGAIENQLVYNGNFVDDSGWGRGSNNTAITISNGVAHTSAIDTSVSGNKYIYQTISKFRVVKDHYYLLRAKVKTDGTNVWIRLTDTPYAVLLDARKQLTANVWTDVELVAKATASSTGETGAYFLVFDGSASTFLDAKECQCIDLTQEFGTGNEPTDVNDKRIKRIIEKYRPHNTGTYNSTIIESVETKGFNIWDEEWENGRIVITDGTNSSGNGIRSKNYIKVIPNTTYYNYLGGTYTGATRIFVYFYDANKNFINYSSEYFNSTFTTPANAHYLRFAIFTDVAITQYNHDICINRSGERNGEYVPHRWQDFYQKVEYIESTGTQYMDTGINADSKLGVKFHALEVSGRFGAYARINDTDFRHHTYADMTKMYGFYQWGYEDIAGYGDHDIQANWLNNKKLFDVKTQTEYDLSGANFDLSINYYLFARNSDSVSYWTGKLYHLSMSVETTIVRNFIPVYRKQDGTIGLYDLVEGKFYVNQGTGTFKKGADVPNDNVIKLPAPLQLDGAINSRNSFEITKNGYVFTRRVWWADLGTPTWNASSDGVNTFYCDVGNVKRVSNNDTIANIMCPKYCTTTRNEVSGINKAVSVNTNGSFHVHDTDYNNPTAFKTAMAGVLIYYELATPQVITIPKKHLKAVDLGSLVWTKHSSLNGEFHTDISEMVLGISTALPNIYCHAYKTAESNSPATVFNYYDIVISVQPNTSRLFIIDKNKGTLTAQQFAEAVKGVYLFYETQDEVDDYLLDEGLPKEYQRVEYIQNTGTQYIDTGFKHNFANGFKIKTKVMPLSTPSDSNRFSLYSTYPKDNNFTLELRGTSLLQAYFYSSYVCYTSSNTIVVNQINNVEFVYSATEKYVKANNNQTAVNFDSVVQSAYSGYIFIDYEGRWNVFTCQSKLYSYQLYDGNTLARDFVPCYRKADGVIGLYDRVTKRFFTNAGTGTFAKGNDVYENVNEELYQRGGEINGYKPTLPSEYERVEYLQSSGAEYINTDLDGKNGYTFECDVEYISFPNDYSYIAGFGETSTNRIYFTRVQKSSLTEGFTFSSANNSQITCQANTKYHYKSIMKTGEQKLYRNGELVLNTTSTAINQYGKIWLFTSNYAGDPNGSCAIKMYGCQFYYEDKLVRDFIPAVRKSDNVAGLYDMVTRQFFTNQGTGTFAVGGYVERPHETCEVLPNVEVSLQCK